MVVLVILLSAAVSGGLLTALGLAVMIRRSQRAQRQLEADLREQQAAAQAQLEALQAQIAELSRRGSSASDRALVPGKQTYVITDAGQATRLPVPDRLVFNATLGGPLLKLTAIVHGLRRALAPETRNRARFAMRQEVIRARKARRRAQKQAWNEYRLRQAEARVDPDTVEAVVERDQIEQ